MEKTIAQRLNIQKLPFEIKDEKGNITYWESERKISKKRIWYKQEFDKKGCKTYFENSDGFWTKYEYDSMKNPIYCHDSDGDWEKREFDEIGNQIYCETSRGTQWIKESKDHQE